MTQVGRGSVRPSYPLYIIFTVLLPPVHNRDLLHWHFCKTIFVCKYLSFFLEEVFVGDLNLFEKNSFTVAQCFRCLLIYFWFFLLTTSRVTKRRMLLFVLLKANSSFCFGVGDARFFLMVVLNMISKGFVKLSKTKNYRIW